MSHHYENEETLLNTLRELSSAIYDDPGYHTPKNIFNPELTKSVVERPSRNSFLPLKPSPPPDENHENPYASIRKTPRWDVEALVAKSASSSEKDDNSESNSTSRLVKLLGKLDFCDYVLFGALVCTVILFLIGVCIILF